MAIYSCSLSSVGRTTHAAGTAGAHLRYVSRDGAAPVVESHVIPADPAQARTWMDREEHAARANARLLDKLRIAIPRELNKDERVQLVRDFVSGVTQDRVPWLFAIHQEGEAGNPHAHIVLRDRDLQTGRRLLRLSDSARDREKAGLVPKAVEWIRERWEHHANAALERAGQDVRIDRRSLKNQGIDRAPTIHLGPRAQHIEEHVQRADRRNAAMAWAVRSTIRRSTAAAAAKSAMLRLSISTWSAPAGRPISRRVCAPIRAGAMAARPAARERARRLGAQPDARRTGAEKGFSGAGGNSQI